MSGAPAPPCRKESVEVVQVSGQDAYWTSPWGGVSGMTIQEETTGSTKDELEKLYLSIGVPPEELVVQTSL